VTIPEKNISSLPADLFKDVPASVVVNRHGKLLSAVRTPCSPW
jgi:hypothetical protein